LSDREIARIEGVHSESVREWRIRRGLVPNSERNKAKANMRDRLARYRAGLNDAAIAQIEGVTKGTIWKWRRRNDLPANTEQPIKTSVRASLSLDRGYARHQHDSYFSDWLEDMGATCSSPPALANASSWRIYA